MTADEDEIEQIESLPPMSDEDKAEFGMTGKPPSDDDRRQRHRQAIAEIQETRPKMAEKDQSE